MEEEFKVGDVVRLKSGSPDMTVNFVENDKVYLLWFDNSTICKDSVYSRTLEKV